MDVWSVHPLERTFVLDMRLIEEYNVKFTCVDIWRKLLFRDVILLLTSKEEREESGLYQLMDTKLYRSSLQDFL